MNNQNKNNSVKYIKAPDVFYKLFDENTLVYKTGKQKVYLYNSIVFDIIMCFDKYISALDCIEMIGNKYALEDEDKEWIEEFINSLANEGILKEENILEERKGGVELSFYNAILPQYRLYRAQFELTFRCNEKCKYCYCIVDNEREELTLDEIKDALNQLKELDVFELTFTGGDLFVRKDAFEILEYAYSLGFLINIFTNGIAIKDEDFFRLKKIYPRSIHFSIYSHIPEKHDEFTQVKGSFQKTIEAIKKCVLLSIPVNIKTCVTDFNVDDIDGIMNLAKELGTTIQVSLSVNAKNDGDKEPLGFRLKSVSDYASVMKKLSEHIVLNCSSALDLSRLSEKSGICGAGSNSININPYGDVFPCNALLMKCGNIREGKIEDIWQNSQVMKTIREFTMDKVKGCEGCEHIVTCNYCPGSALIEKGDPLCKYEEACVLSEAKKLSEE
ncbi:MAG: radical SAM protein [Clostridia bacterium]|nr:radical SAM protein [Clostridia bacterium]